MNKNKFLPLCGTVPVLAAGLYYAILLKDIAQQTGDMLPLKLYALLLPAVLFGVAAAGSALTVGFLVAGSLAAFRVRHQRADGKADLLVGFVDLDNLNFNVLANLQIIVDIFDKGIGNFRNVNETLGVFVVKSNECAERLNAGNLTFDNLSYFNSHNAYLLKDTDPKTENTSCLRKRDLLFIRRSGRRLKTAAQSQAAKLPGCDVRNNSLNSIT